MSGNFILFSKSGFKKYFLKNWNIFSFLLLQIDTGDENANECDVHIKGKTLEDCENAREKINDNLGYGKSVEPKPDEFVEIDWGNVMAQHEEAQKIKWGKWFVFENSYLLFCIDILNLGIE